MTHGSRPVLSKTNQSLAQQRKGISRRNFVGGCSAAVLASGSLATTRLLKGQETGGQESGTASGNQEATQATQGTTKTKSAKQLITAETQAAIDRGLLFLSRRQLNNGPNRGAYGTSGYACGVAVSALSGLAMMCGGSSPGEGPYGKQVNRSVEFLLTKVRDKGYIARSDNQAHENMYGHGFAMLFLSEAYGMTQKTEIGDKLRKAVGLTVSCQNPKGGWRYQPDKNQTADLSITVCQIMGLRAARDAGLHVPDETRKKCIEYVLKSQNDNGSFRYQLSGGHSTFAMTAAGVTSLYSAGIYDSEEVKKALAYLMKNMPGRGSSGGHYFYGQYYAVQAMWHAGGEYWNKWYPAIRNELLSKQSADGSWSGSGGNEYGTAMACIILQMPLTFLPVFSP